jgi:hypothetical protein
MPVNAAEAYLTRLAERTFLKLWSYSNPFRAPGKEIVDLIVVFGDDVILFSDKASAYRASTPLLAWQRWYQRTISESIKQLAGAVRVLSDPNAAIYVDDRASQAFPFALPALGRRRLHLIAVAHTKVEPSRVQERWSDLAFDSAVAGPNTPFKIGPLHVKEHLVHLIEGTTLETLLTELDTIADFVGYLDRRATAIRGCERLAFRELDLLALSLQARDANGWSAIPLPQSNADHESFVPAGLWAEYRTSDRARRSRINRPSYTIDRLIEHFHQEYINGRFFGVSLPSFASHEQALRSMATESRFGRRIIATEMYEILNEPDQRTFWASTVQSRDVPGVRYVWLAYPDPPQDAELDRAEQFLLHHLKEHIFVARALFPADLIIGVALPNSAATTTSYIMTVFDGTNWTKEDQEGAERLCADRGIFKQPEALARRHIL